MKKTAVTIFSLLFFLIVAVCQIKAADIGVWKVTVHSSAGQKEFTSADAAKLTPVSIEATTRNRFGAETSSRYTGVKLSDILKHAGAPDFWGLTIEAGDGFSVDYDRTLALRDDTILAWERDGDLFEGDFPLQMAPKSGVGNQFIRMVAKIIVND
jgi:hypothetical protein